MSGARRGFTLIEIVVALVITGVVALTSYAALDAGIGTRQRIDGPLRDRESTQLARTMLEDALRHVVDRGLEGEAFARNEGGAGDVLAFNTRGIVAPLGGSALWRVEMRGGTLRALPVDEPGPELRAELTDVRAIEVATLGPDGWRRDAAPLDRMPDAVRVDFVTRAGAPPLAPVVVRLTGGALR